MKEFAVICTLASTSVVAAATGAAQPNVIFILADDIGWSDLSCYGNTFHETPNIDRLARAGVRFTNFHTASPVCSPTRASILTGLYAERLGMTQPACHIELEQLKAFLPKSAEPGDKLVTPKSSTRLDTSFPTLSRSLQAAGYRTGHFGKWHLGLPPYTPGAHGFDEESPGWCMHGPNGTYLGPSRYTDSFSLAQGEHLEDRMAGEAVRFIEDNKKRPFFLNYWAFSAHSPFVAKPDLIQKYRKKAKSLTPDAPHRNPVYAAMVQSLDEAVGRILDAVENAGISDRTIVVFTSDNGPEVLSIKEAGQKPWTNGSADMLDIPITSSAPFRGGKGTIHEGATRVPCLIVWPGMVQAGLVSDAMFSSVDFFPTLLEMTGTPMPDASLDGVSQVPALLSKQAPRNALYGYWPNYPPERLRESAHYGPAAWVQQDGYKLVCYFSDGPNGEDRLELYSLAADPGEKFNVSAQEPERTERLRDVLRKHHQDTRALLPFPNPSYQPDIPSPHS